MITSIFNWIGDLIGLLSYLLVIGFWGYTLYFLCMKLAPQLITGRKVDISQLGHIFTGFVAFFILLEVVPPLMMRTVESSYESTVEVGSGLVESIRQDIQFHSTNTKHVNYSPNTQITTGMIRHVVQEGESVKGIADTYGIPAGRLDAITNGEPKKGQLIEFPETWVGAVPTSIVENIEPFTTPVIIAPTSSDESSSNDYIIYIVKPSDTLRKIAERYNVTVERLQQINNLSNPNMIYVGNRLKIPTD